MYSFSVNKSFSLRARTISPSTCEVIFCSISASVSVPSGFIALKEINIVSVSASYVLSLPSTKLVSCAIVPSGSCTKDSVDNISLLTTTPVSFKPTPSNNFLISLANLVFLPSSTACEKFIILGLVSIGGKNCSCLTVSCSTSFCIASSLKLFSLLNLASNSSTVSLKPSALRAMSYSKLSLISNLLGLPSTGCTLPLSCRSRKNCSEASASGFSTRVIILGEASFISLRLNCILFALALDTKLAISNAEYFLCLKSGSLVLTLKLGSECNLDKNNFLAPFVALFTLSYPVTFLEKSLTAGSLKSRSIFFDAAKSFKYLLVTFTSDLSLSIAGLPSFIDSLKTISAKFDCKSLKSLVGRIFLASSIEYVLF